MRKNKFVLDTLFVGQLIESTVESTPVQPVEQDDLTITLWYGSGRPNCRENQEKLVAFLDMFGFEYKLHRLYDNCPMVSVESLNLIKDIFPDMLYG